MAARARFTLVPRLLPAPAWDRSVLEALPTPVNIFEFSLINEIVGRECEAPAELCPVAGTDSIACGRWAAARKGSAGASPSRNPLSVKCKDVYSPGSAWAVRQIAFL